MFSSRKLQKNFFARQRGFNIGALQRSDFAHFLYLSLANGFILLTLGVFLALMVEDKAERLLALCLMLSSLIALGLSLWFNWKNLPTVSTASKIITSLETLQDGYLLTDGNGKTLYANVGFRELFPEITEKSLKELAAEGDASISEDIFKNSYKPFSEGPLDPYELVIRGGEQKRKVYLKRSMSNDKDTVLWKIDKISLYLKEIHDIFYQQGEFLKAFDIREIFDLAPAGIVFLDADCRVKVINKTFLDKFLEGYQPPSGTLFADLLVADKKATFAKSYAAFLEGRNPIETVEICFEATPETPAIAYIGGLARSADSRGAALYIFDNSEQQKIQLSLIQSQKLQAMGQLAGGIAHDFNNLLTAMIGFCDLLLLRHSPGDQSFTDIMQIKQNANRAANLVRQLLAFSRQQTLQPRVLDISETLANLSLLLQRLIGVSIKLRIIHGRDLGLIKVDQGQFEQVIINLLVNARDAVGESGEITIRTSNKTFKEATHIGHEVIGAGIYVLLEVIDSGQGIHPESLTRIFDPFFSTKEIGSGTGLGLSTVYGIVKQTGGFVLVESEPDKGTKFSIYLPRHEGEARSLENDRDTQAIESRDLTGQGRILLVEDEDAVRLFSARALRNKGYHVIEASNGEEALEHLISSKDKKSEPLDLLITDVVMPQMDGPTLVKKALEHIPDLRVIYISGYAEDSFRRQLDKEEDIHFLSKPFSLKTLATKVKEVLSLDGVEENLSPKGRGG